MIYYLLKCYIFCKSSCQGVTLGKILDQNLHSYHPYWHLSQCYLIWAWGPCWCGGSRIPRNYRIYRITEKLCLDCVDLNMDRIKWVPESRFLHLSLWVPWDFLKNWISWGPRFPKNWVPFGSLNGTFEGPLSIWEHCDRDRGRMPPTFDFRIG